MRQVSDGILAALCSEHTEPDHERMLIIFTLSTGPGPVESRDTKREVFSLSTPPCLPKRESSFLRDVRRHFCGVMISLHLHRYYGVSCSNLITGNR